MVARDTSTDITLLDLLLPDADDRTVLSAMHKLAPNMPIILLTSYGSRKLCAETRVCACIAPRLRLICLRGSLRVEAAARLVERRR
jgi:DNA-binding NarL/FixJ family response regulator